MFRSYHHGNILAFGDLLHRIHVHTGQGFNMTIRDINILIGIVKASKFGFTIDSSVNNEFENTNYIFSNGIDFIHEFFNLREKLTIIF